MAREKIRKGGEYDIKYSRRADRLEACRLAARVMASRPDVSPNPLLWGLCVFFETYIGQGCGATRKDFGPKKPVKLKIVKKEKASE